MKLPQFGLWDLFAVTLLLGTLFGWQQALAAQAAAANKAIDLGLVLCLSAVAGAMSATSLARKIVTDS